MNRDVALEALFRSEIEFHRLARQSKLSPQEEAEQHGRYATQMAYDREIEAARGATLEEIDRLANRLLCTGDARDVLSARDSVRGLLGLKQFET
jgi:hypothetical protein